MSPCPIRHDVSRAALALLFAAAGCDWFEADVAVVAGGGRPPGANGGLAVGALAPGDELGSAVAAAPDLIAVGAPGDDRRGSEAGAIHLFVPDAGGWSEQGVLVADDARVGDRFGSGLALAGDLLAVGAPGRDQGGRSEVGAVYVYQSSGPEWQLSAMLFAPDGFTGDFFGSAVAFVDPDLLAIGAPGQDGAQPSAGATYLFQRQGTSWVPVPLR